jgi:hypothetical protein
MRSHLDVAVPTLQWVNNQRKIEEFIFSKKKRSHLDVAVADLAMGTVPHKKKVFFQISKYLKIK